jgi:hypothetical protein
MASRKKPTPGYEPAKGHVDPEYVPPTTTSVTHYPHGQGPVCGYKPTPTHAQDYDNVTPTCPPCAKWLAAAKMNTAARFPQAVQRTVAKAAAAAAPKALKE